MKSKRSTAVGGAAVGGMDVEGTAILDEEEAEPEDLRAVLIICLHVKPENTSTTESENNLRP